MRLQRMLTYLWWKFGKTDRSRVGGNRLRSTWEVRWLGAKETYSLSLCMGQNQMQWGHVD